MRNEKRVPFLDQFAFGLLCGSVFVLASAWLIDEQTGDVIENHFLEIVGYLIALSLALLALYGVRRQIEHQALLDSKRQKADLASARVVMPLVLVTMTRVARSGMWFSLQPSEFYDNPENVELVAEELNVSAEEINILRDCVKFSDVVTQAWISAMISNYQIARSRMLRDLGDATPTQLESTQLSHLLDWARLNAIAEHLFDFAREEVQVSEARLDPSLVRTPISRSMIQLAMYDRARAHVAEWAKKQTTFDAKTMRM